MERAQGGGAMTKMWPDVLRDISCGALRASLVRGTNYDAVAVVSHIGGAEPWFCMPFGQRPAERLIAIDERNFLALASAGAAGDGFLMTVMDAVEQKVIAGPLKVDAASIYNQLVVSRGGTRLTCVKSFESPSWTLPDLQPEGVLVTPALNPAEAAVRDDGAIVVRCHGRQEVISESPPPNYHPLVLCIAADGQSFETFGQAVRRPYGDASVSLSRFALSPDGRTMVRPHDGSLFITGPDGEPAADLATIASGNDRERIAALERVQIHGVVEVWDAAPLAFRRRIVVRTLPMIDCFPPPRPMVESIGIGGERQAALKKLLRLRDGNWATKVLAAIGRPFAGKQPDARRAAAINAARADLDRIDNLRDALVRGQRALETAALMAPLAPYGAWTPDAPAMFHLEGARGLAWWHVFMPLLNTVRGEVAGWNSATEFRMTFADGKQRSVSIDGDLAEVADQPARTFLPAAFALDIEERAREFIDRSAVVTIELGGLDETSCIAAIEALARVIETEPARALWGREMNVRFRHAGGVLTEEAFFEHVAASCPGAAAALPRLLAVLDEVEMGGEGVWSTEMVSAGGFPALALALLDPCAFEHLEGYFGRRDPGHEPHGIEQVFPALAPFTTMEGVRFGLRRMLDEQHGGPGGSDETVARRLIADARSVSTPHAFLEAMDHEYEFMLALWDREDIDRYKADARSVLAKAVDQAKPWDRQLRQLLKQS